MRVGVALAAMLLAWSPSPLVSAQDDLVLHTYPYSGLEIGALYETRPESARIDPALMPEATVEAGAQLEILASQSQVAAMRVNAAWQGSIDGCGNRLWYSADSSTITQRADGSFEVAMTGFWLWDVTSRLGGLTQGVCTEKKQELTEFTATIVVNLESGSPVVTAATGVALPERATQAPVADPSPPGITADEPVTEVGGQVIPGVDGRDSHLGDGNGSDARTDAARDALDSTESESPPVAANTGDQRGTSGRTTWSLTVWLFLLLGLVAGVGGVWIAMKAVLMWRGRRLESGLRAPAESLQPGELSRRVEQEWDKGVTDPTPTIGVYDDDRRERRIGIEPPATAPTTPSPTSVPVPPPASFAPSHQIVLEGEIDTGRAPGHALHGTRVTMLEAGQQVEVISVKGDYVTVRCSDGQPLRVDRRNLRPISNRE